MTKKKKKKNKEKILIKYQKISFNNMNNRFKLKNNNKRNKKLMNFMNI